MFKSALWRNDKNKVKVEFKLQFHAAKVPQVGEDALVISVVPADYGKPTVKTDKVAARDGNCIWENPVYETVKFYRDPKSGKIHERIYYFVVGTVWNVLGGSSKGGVIGEAAIDFSNYAEVSKVTLVSLPLKHSKTEAVLHVSIQRMQEPNDLSEVEENESAKLSYKEHSLKAQFSNSDVDANIKSNSQDFGLKGVPQIAELNSNRRASSVSDVTLSSSESSSGVEIPWQPPVKNDSFRQDPASGLVSSSRPDSGSLAGTPTVVYEERQRSRWEWLGNSALEASTDDSSSTPRETFLQQNSEETSDIFIEKLKSDVAALSRQAEMSELELQTLRKQIVKESKRSQDLFRELACLKKERDALKGECERHKSFQRCIDDTKTTTNLQFEGGSSRVVVEELREELNNAKELNSTLQIQLQKTEESNSELSVAVRDLEEMLEKKNKEISNLSNGSLTRNLGPVSKGVDSIQRLQDENDDKEQKALEEIVKEHKDANELYLREQQIMDMRSEIEIFKRDKDELEMQLEQLALDYEIMKQENHDMAYKLEQSEIQEQLKMQCECSSSYATAQELEAHIEKLENELKRESKESADALDRVSELEAHVKNLEEELEKQSQIQEQLKMQYECSPSYITSHELEAHIENLENELKRQSKESADALGKVRVLEAQVKSLEEELEKQSQLFEADLEALTRSKVEQEQRAITAEEALRKTRWQNTNTAEKLQEEFRKLSVQMASTFAANEKLASKALSEANELRVQKRHLEEMIQKTSEEQQSMKGQYEARLHQLASQVMLMTNQIQRLQSEIEDKVLQLGCQKKHAEETRKKLTDENLKLQDEIERCVAKIKILSEEIGGKETLMHQVEQMRISIKELEFLVKQGNDERAKLEKIIASWKTEAEESQKDLHKVRRIVKEKEEMAGTLQSDLDHLRSQFTELKNSMLDAVEPTSEATNHVLCDSKKVADLKQRIKLLETKLKENDMDASTNTLVGKEMDLLNQIKELGEGPKELNQSTIHCCENEVKILTGPAEDLAPNVIASEEARNNDCNSSDLSKAHNIDSSAVLSQSNNSAMHNTGYIIDSKGEMALLKERNESMEEELKEMQQRYSKLSLKFAEVEGERQQLAMKLRYLKSVKKRSSNP